MTTERRPFTITQVEQDQRGVWRARVTVDGQAFEVDREFGSWMTTPRDPRGVRQDVLPLIAAALQARVRPLEKTAADKAAALAAAAAANPFLAGIPG